MTSKCGKNKKVAHEAIAECVTDEEELNFIRIKADGDVNRASVL